jgi:hypothetical protein
MKPNAGWTGVKALRYSGGHTADGRGYAYDKVFDVDVKVTRRSELSYLIFPEFDNNDLSYPSTYAPSTSPSPTAPTSATCAPRPARRRRSSPQGQGASQVALREPVEPQGLRIGAVAAGKTIDRILVGYDNPTGTPTSAAGSTTSASTAARQGAARAVRLGAHDPRHQLDGGFSRGNNIPATAVPHGFNFWTPMTDAGSISWLYEYQRDNNDDEPAADRGVRRQPRAEPVDGRPPDLPGHAVAGRRRRRTRPRAARCRSGTRTRSPSRYYYGVTFENGMRPRSRRPTTPRCSGSRSPATSRT